MHDAGDVTAVQVNPVTGQNGLHLLRSFKAGETICAFSAGEVFPKPTWLTVQTGDDRHITLLPMRLQYINHSCDPNVFFDTTNMVLVVLKSMKDGEEMTFFYPSTEWEMAQPFTCHCGSEQCLGLINGASGMDPAVLGRYKLTDYIQNKLDRNLQTG
jgi:hypothetical protein